MSRTTTSRKAPAAPGSSRIGRRFTPFRNGWARMAWTVITSEMGYIPKNVPELNDSQRAEVGEFLQHLDDHDDVHRVWAAVK